MSKCRYARMVGYHMDYCANEAQDVEVGLCKKHLGVVRAQDKRAKRRYDVLAERQATNERRRAAFNAFREACAEVGESNPEFLGKYAAVSVLLRMQYE